MADAPLTRGALAPGTSKDIVFQVDGGVRGKRGDLYRGKRGGEKEVLYEVPNKERISNVLDGLSQIFLIG
jgi:hypothetical protein